LALAHFSLKLCKLLVTQAVNASDFSSGHNETVSSCCDGRKRMNFTRVNGACMRTRRVRCFLAIVVGKTQMQAPVAVY
ncbi:hypothetical protein P4T20_17225, partial [Aneurinibacillus thermoaerophilus]|uniref:hypothetical protein n=1 Tax=Aneurinibacillus thermoaerophilus TaxID=143495 RepID=UPI002E20F1C6|nr:hypothetical protein [Aneurinibacillus thermoaerophilus]